jgi:hypothetical protein
VARASLFTTGRVQSGRIAALDAAGIAWRLVFTSPSLSGLCAAVEAGHRLSLRTTFAMPGTLAPVPLAAALCRRRPESGRHAAGQHPARNDPRWTANDRRW